MLPSTIIIADINKFGWYSIIKRWDISERHSFRVAFFLFSTQREGVMELHGEFSM